MGVIFAVLSMTLFSIANITIVRGSDGKTRSGGAFLSIIITFGLSLAIWSFSGFSDGLTAPSGTAVAWFALAGILTIFIGRVFLYASIQQLGAVRASAVKRLNPFFSVFLGVVLLGEAINGPMLAGIGLICASFTLLVRQSLQSEKSERTETVRQSAFERAVNLGYLFGPVSAFAYASGYVARKQGLLLLPDAAFGAMVGALSGIVAFVVTAAFVRNYRNDLRQTFTVFNPWLLAAGVLSSLGQICYFVALSYSSISKIALITSMEVFVTIFLSVVIFRSKEKLTFDIIIAAILGVAGTMFVVAN